MRNYYDYIRSQSMIYKILVYTCLFLLIFYIFMIFFGYSWIIGYKSQDAKNIVSGCAYYDGETKDKYGVRYHLKVDGYVVDNVGYYSRGFPLYFKMGRFYENLRKYHAVCYKVKYIEIDLYLTKKIFIYDYLD